MKFIMHISTFFLFIACATTGQDTTENRNVNNGVAIEGYDPVAYFEDGKAVKGDKEFAATIEGLNYYCSSEKNKQLLLANPDAYEPEYGGWCAYAMGDSGKEVQIDPESFKIVDGKLYLFYDSFFSHTLIKWNKDEPNLMKKANANWKSNMNH